jgi:sugar phosphate isomerase/epimerase
MKSPNDFFLLVSNNGIRNIELSGGEYMHPTALEELLTSFREKRGFSYLIHNYFPPAKDSFILNIAATDETLRKKSVNFAKTAMKFGVKQGAKMYTVHAGYRTDLTLSKDGEVFQPVNSRIVEVGDSLNQLKVSIEELCSFAATKSMIFGIENLFPPKEGKNFSVLCTYEEIEIILKTFADYDNFGLLLDLGHAKISGHLLGFDPLAFAKKLNDNYRGRILGYHISDNDGCSDLHLLPPLNSWMVDYLLNFGKVGVPITIEARNSPFEKVILFYHNLVESLCRRMYA